MEARYEVERDVLVLTVDRWEATILRGLLKDMVDHLDQAPGGAVPGADPAVEFLRGALAHMLAKVVEARRVAHVHDLEIARALDLKGDC